MLQASHVSYEYTPLQGPVFAGVTFAVGEGDKIGLLGPNGCGKSTLLKILSGELRPTAGRIVSSHGCTASYLPQDFDFQFPGTLGEALESSGLPGPSLLKAAHRLGLSRSLLAQPYSTLSLGERMRAALATVLAREPDILLLDEPTNHLDLDARLWLERFLLDCREGVLMVCHDRAMLDAVVRETWVLERGALTTYAGGYSAMLEAREQDFERRHDAWLRDSHEIRRLKNVAERTLQRAAQVAKRPTGGKTFDPKHSPFYKAKAARMDRRAKAIRQRVEHAEADRTAKPFVGDAAKLAFPTAPLRACFALTVSRLSKGYGPRKLFEGVSFALAPGERLAVVGPNGCGKTTLFRILLGLEASDDGEVAWGPGTRLGYLSQSRRGLREDLPALQALGELTSDEEEFARTLLGRLGLRGDDVTRPMSHLSVGERTKVELVRVLLDRANVLILDEPTNHLDVDSLEALESALAEFPGSVLFASHDRAFVDKMAHGVLSLEAR